MDYMQAPPGEEVSYRAAAVTFWGEAGAYAYDSYARIRTALYPDLPEHLPIVIGITPYGRCLGLTRGGWEHGPRITLPPEVFRGTTAANAQRRVPGGTRQVDDDLTHEMLHVWLLITGRQVSHDSEDWYEAVRRLSLAVLGHELDARRGAGRKSVRIPNPAYRPGAGIPKTLVRKQRVTAPVTHADVATWPRSFRPANYDWGQPIACPSC
jgi:hypothetical protein